MNKHLTAMMVEDFIFDPILASKVIFGIDLPPHEELRVMWMWSTYYTNDDSGFSTGKTFTFALVSALRSILFPYRVSGVLSKTFAQGKLIFGYYDKWHNSSQIFRSCIRHARGSPRLIHGQDAHVAEFRGGSQIRILPPHFLGDSERIKSERWNEAYLDEWTSYGNFKALNTTIIGRVSKVNKYNDCPIRRNHIHLASTPQYKHHPSYSMVKRIDRLISMGNPDYGRFSVNYRAVPETEQWDWMIDKRTIFHMQTNLPRGAVRAEIDGQWADDSATWYSSAVVNECRLDVVPLMMERKDTNDVFLAGFDVARGGGETTTNGDDFALSVFRLMGGRGKPIHVLTIRKNKITSDQMAGIIHKYHRLFGFSVIVYDPGGGGLFVKDSLRKPLQTIDNEEVGCRPILEYLDFSGSIGDNILVGFSRGDFIMKQLWKSMASDSVMLNKLHHDFKGAIENKNVILSGKWIGWSDEGAEWDVEAKREWLNSHQNLEEKEKAKANTDLAVEQLIHVDCDRDDEGRPLTDSYGMFRFSSKSKKDAAYSLIYAYFAFLVFTSGKTPLSRTVDKKKGNMGAISEEMTYARNS